MTLNGVWPPTRAVSALDAYNEFVTKPKNIAEMRRKSSGMTVSRHWRSLSRLLYAFDNVCRIM